MFKYVTSIENQIGQYQLAAYSVNTGFFQKNRFYLLPTLPEKFRSRVILFPEITEYFSDFSQYSQFDNYQIENLPAKVTDSITAYSSKHTKLLTACIDKLKSGINEIENKFTKALKEEFPNFPNYEIEISPKLFGSYGSYSTTASKDIIKIHPRYDSSVPSVLKTIIAYFAHKTGFDKDQYLNNQTFIDKQVLAQRIAQSSRFAMFNFGKNGTIDMLKTKFVAKYAVESADYYGKLGFPIKPYITTTKQIPNLTDTEEKILTKLMQNRCKIVSFDEISEIMWGDEATEKYSLYAITKIIDRIKKKIYETGIHTALIHTQRSEGYLLYD